jgi:DNA-binding GntR family transcriptional regulator
MVRRAVVIAGSGCCDAAAEQRAGLRPLLELRSVRALADRGLSDDELVLVTKLAEATVQAARSRDVLAYRRADVTFHLCLLDLTGDPALSDIARVVLVPDPGCGPGVRESSHLMAGGAREHRELARMLGDGMVAAADQLLRLHLSRLPHAISGGGA